MNRKVVILSFLLVFSTLLISACGSAAKQSTQTPFPTLTSLVALSTSTPTPIPPLCTNQFFPNKLGDSWRYSGNNSAIGDYTRTDTITASSDRTFTVESILANITYSVVYTCSEAGITTENPVQPYLGAFITGPDAPVKLTLTSATGISLPAKINAGDTWQQTADMDATIQGQTMNGRLVIDYSAVGFESVTVPAGTFNAIRVDATVTIQVTPLHIPAGTYTISQWLAPGVGLIKTDGTSHIPGMEFTDGMQLTGFVPSP